MHDAAPLLVPFLSSSDAVLRGLAAWVVGLLGPEAARSQLEALANDSTEIPIYLDRELHYRSVKNLAAEALAVGQ
jgi:HEAT repeat protein